MVGESFQIYGVLENVFASLGNFTHALDKTQDSHNHPPDREITHSPLRGTSDHKRRKYKKPSIT